MATLKDMVKDNKKVFFRFYRNNELWYVTEDGFEFPVPTSDIGDAVFLSEDRAILFMRYIRKHMELIDGAKEEQAPSKVKTLEAGPPEAEKLVAKAREREELINKIKNETDPDTRRMLIGELQFKDMMG